MGIIEVFQIGVSRTHIISLLACMHLGGGGLLRKPCDKGVLAAPVWTDALPVELDKKNVSKILRKRLLEGLHKVLYGGCSGFKVLQSFSRTAKHDKDLLYMIFPFMARIPGTSNWKQKPNSNPKPHIPKNRHPKPQKPKNIWTLAFNLFSLFSVSFQTTLNHQTLNTPPPKKKKKKTTTITTTSPNKKQTLTPPPPQKRPHQP